MVVKIAVASGLILGIALLAATDSVVQFTSTTKFCLSCHEMQVPFEELQQTVHYSNASGVRLECSDCHIPRDRIGKYLAKFRAIDDLYGHFISGVISTPEKYETHRMNMAETVWTRMRANDSKQCRYCHSFTAMDFEKQGKRPARKHPKAMQRGATCIECHRGVAHKIPRDAVDD